MIPHTSQELVNINKLHTLKEGSKETKAMFLIKEDSKETKAMFLIKIKADLIKAMVNKAMFQEDNLATIKEDINKEDFLKADLFNLDLFLDLKKYYNFAYIHCLNG